MSLRCTKFRLIIYVYLKNKDELVTFYNDAKVTQIRKLENKRKITTSQNQPWSMILVTFCKWCQTTIAFKILLAIAIRRIFYNSNLI